MPKVKEGYYQEKKNKLLDIALQICNHKPVYDVKMSDIISESGMSQGGVYKYFSDIDEVFAALINRANAQKNYIEQINALVESKDSPETILLNLFSFSELYFSDMLISYNKILFELGTFFAHDSKRRDKITKNVESITVFEYLSQKMYTLLFEQTESGYFTPILPLKEVFAFVIAAFDGIIRDVTLTKCYLPATETPPLIVFDEKQLIKSLYISTLTLLGKQCPVQEGDNI